MNRSPLTNHPTHLTHLTQLPISPLLERVCYVWGVKVEVKAEVKEEFGLAAKSREETLILKITASESANQ